MSLVKLGAKQFSDTAQTQRYNNENIATTIISTEMINLAEVLTF